LQDSANGETNINLDILVESTIEFVSSPPPPAGEVSQRYTYYLNVRNATEPPIFEIVNGSLPPGLTFVQGGTISGIPTDAGVYTASFRARSGTQEALATYTFNIQSTNFRLLPVSLPNGRVNQSYSGQLRAEGGSPPYVFLCTSTPPLPTGLTLRTDGTFEGTPNQAGTFNLRIEVYDTNTRLIIGNGVLQIAPATLQLTSGDPPRAIVRQPYSFQLAATGGSGPYVYSLASGNLAWGLQLSPTGLISGTTSGEETASFSIRVRDAQGAEAVFAMQIVVGGSTLSLANTPPLQPGRVGEAYAYSFVVRGGFPPYRLSVASGELPEGLSLSNEGAISGTPRRASAFPFVIEVRDANGNTANGSYLIWIQENSQLRLRGPIATNIEV
jgi:hypothetical protein